MKALIEETSSTTRLLFATAEAKNGVTDVQQIVIDAPAGQLSAELRRRGIPADVRLHVIIELLEDEPLPMAAMAAAARALGSMADEPGLYSEVNGH
jgi:hypothetical protein